MDADIDQPSVEAPHHPLRFRAVFLVLALAVLILGTVGGQARDDKTDDQTGTTPATPAPANPATDGTAGKDALAQTPDPNTPPSRSVAKGQNGGDGGDALGATKGGKGGKGGSATAIAQSNVPGVVSATATGGAGGEGGAGNPGGDGGNGGNAKAQASGKSVSASVEAIGGLGGMGISSTPRGGASGKGGDGGNAEALLDVQDSGQKVMARAVGGEGGGGGLGVGGGTKGLQGNGGNGTVTAKKVIMTGANDVEINLEARGGPGGNLGGSATNILEGTSAQSAKLTLRTVGGTAVGRSGDASCKVNFTAQNDLVIDASSSVVPVSKNPAGVGGDSKDNNYTLISKTGGVTGKVGVQAGPVVAARMGQGGSAAANVSATAAGDIKLQLQVAAGWGGNRGGNANATLVGTSPNGKVDLFAGTRGGSGDSMGTGITKVSGTGKSGMIEAVAQSGNGADQPQPVVKPVGGVQAVTADAKAPVDGNCSAESETRIGTFTPNLTGLTTPQATAIVSGAPLASDVLRETAGSPNVLQQVVLGKQILGLAGLGASYPTGGSGGSATCTASAIFEIDPGEFTQDILLTIGLFKPVFNGPDFETITFQILENGSLLESRTFTDETQLLQYFDDNVLTFSSPVPGSSSDVTLDFEYSFTAHEQGAGFGFGLVFSTPERGNLMMFAASLACLDLARRFLPRSTHPKRNLASG